MKRKKKGGRGNPTESLAKKNVIKKRMISGVPQGVGRDTVKKKFGRVRWKEEGDARGFQVSAVEKEYAEGRGGRTKKDEYSPPKCAEKYSGKTDSKKS